MNNINKSPQRLSNSAERVRNGSPQQRRHSPLATKKPGLTNLGSTMLIWYNNRKNFEGPLSDIGAKPSSPLHFIHNSLNQLPSSTAKFDKVKKNAKGGVLITPEEIQAAFSMLDADNNARVSIQNMKKRLGVLFPGCSCVSIHVWLASYFFLLRTK